MPSKNNPNKIKIKRTIQRRPRTVKSSNRVVATVPKTGGVIHGGGGVSRKREKREEKKRRYDELRKLAEEGAFMGMSFPKIHAFGVGDN